MPAAQLAGALVPGANTSLYESMPLGSEAAVQLSTICLTPAVALKVPPVGAVMSTVTVALAGCAITFSYLSLNQTYTLVGPLLFDSVHALLVVNGSHAVHAVVLLMHMPATPLASVADKVSVTAVRRVSGPPSSIVTLPTG